MYGSSHFSLFSGNHIPIKVLRQNIDNLTPTKRAQFRCSFNRYLHLLPHWLQLSNITRATYAARLLSPLIQLRG